MNTFHDLFRQPTRSTAGGFPADRRRELLPGFVERSPRLHLWSPGQPTPSFGQRLLIGVATWSGYDMNLLDLLEESPDTGVRIDVFDADTRTSTDELARLLPNLAGLQPPFVGLWEDGKLVETAEGSFGRALVTRVCGLDAAEVEKRMNSLLTRT